MVHSKIIDAIQSNRLVFFVGSGFSKSLGFPNWKELVNKFLESLSVDYKEYNQLRDFYMSSDFMGEIEVLDKIKNHKSRVLEILDNEFSIDESKQSLIKHRKIGQITSKIITTNYDKSLELANTSFKKVVYNNDFRLAKLNDTQEYIFKIHGCVDEPTNCILFREDYDNLYSNHSIYPSAIEELKKIISDNIIIFLGFSFSDPYVKYQFDYIQSVYKGLKNKPFLITTEENVNINEVEIVKISDWNEGLDNLLESLLEIKLSKINTGATLLVDNVLEKKETGLECKIAILVSQPINKNFEYDFQKILKPFKNFNVKIDYYHLSLENLNQLDGYQYIFIYTNILQNKIYIEDEFLASNLITLDALQSEIFTENIDGIFIFTVKTSKLSIRNFQLPVIISKYDEKNMNKLFFKLFRKCELTLLNEDIQTINSSKLNLIKLPQGKMIVNVEKTPLPSEIDSKNLINFVGRTNDLENLSRKILELNGQILTIKASGGLGKTTTVKRVVIELSERGYYSDGIHFIDCEHISDYKTFEYKIGQCFDLDNTINFREHIYQNGFSLNKLIILDNFESLLYLQDTNEIMESVALICDFAAVVITSREWLGFEFEEQFELRALTTDEGVKLFQKYYPHPIDERDMKILRSDIIENLLNNNPLAIKIITTNIPKSKSMEILQKELEEDFFNTTTLGIENIFGDEVDKNIERSNSLYQSINYSYSKLTIKESLFFELLSLFPDGIHMKNFIEFFNGKTNKLTDKEIKSLENKSLIQISGGFIKLQSIVGRFASHKLSLRSSSEEELYFTRAYEYNYFMVSFLRSMKYDMNLPEIKRLEIFDKNLENFSKSFEYLIKVKNDNKMDMLVYVVRLTYYYAVINQRYKCIENLERIKEYFKEIDNANLLIDALIIKLRYYDGDFKESYKKANELFPLEYIYNLNKDFEVEYIEYSIFSHIIQVHRYGNEFHILSKLMELDFFDEEFYFDLLFTLGYYNLLLKYFPFNENDFFEYEAYTNQHGINFEIIDKAIEETYNKDHLTLMQLTYIKAKKGLINRDNVKKLVVINPYTKGLKNLMYAFIEEDFDKAYDLYKDAIRDLEHIKYYFVEAILHCSAFLYKNGSTEFNYWFELGKNYAEKLHYHFLQHKFDMLILENEIPYDESDFVTQQQINQLEEFIRKNKNIKQ